MFRFFITITLFQSLISCSGNSGQELRTLKIAEEGLIQSNNFLAANNLLVYKVLEQRLDESYSSEDARVWQPKALLIKRKSELIYNYLDSLILELKKNSGLQLVNNSEVFDEQNSAVVEKVLTGNNSAENIISRLYKYKNDVLSVDPELNEVFGKNITVISSQYQTTDYKKANAAGSLFNDIPCLAAIIILRRFQNNIINIECEFILFCLNKIPTRGCGFQIIHPLITQSSSIVSRGEKIKIIAGIGAYSITVKPRIIIDGKKIESSETEGFVEYELKVSDQPGKYSTPVLIEFTGPDGQRHSSKNLITYTVKE